MKEEYQKSNTAQYPAEQEPVNNGSTLFRCVFHFFDTSYHPTTKDEIIMNLRNRRSWTSFSKKCNGETEVDSMGKWLGYMVELYYNGQWFNIDQWYRHASGELKHHYLHAAPERNILCSAHDELALSKERIPFSELSAETQAIICAENPAFDHSVFDSWDFFIWGNYSDLAALLQKLAERENDKCVSKNLLKTLNSKIKDQVQIFQRTIPYSVTGRSSERPVRIIICEL